jgi:hypothetical protein
VKYAKSVKGGMHALSVADIGAQAAKKSVLKMMAYNFFI